MNKKVLFKVISITLVLVTFLYPSLLTASQLDFKLAAESRFSEYFSNEKNRGFLSKEGFQANLIVFVNAISELNKAMLGPSQTPDKIRALIDRLNNGLRILGITIDNNIHRRKIGDREVPYLVLAFGEGKERDLFFLGDYDKWADNELAEIGVVTPKDKENLKVPGVQGSWLTGHKEITVGLAAGQEADNPVATLMDLITADISIQLNSDEKRKILRRKKSRGYEFVSVRGKIETRLEEIKLAIEEEVFNLVRVHITAKLGNAALWEVRRSDKEDYFRMPSTIRRRGTRAMIANLPGQPIQGADRFKNLLGRLVEGVINKVPAGKTKSLIDSAIEMLGAKREESGVKFSYRDFNRDTVINSVFKEAGLFTLLRDMSNDALMERVFEQMTNSLLVNPDISTDELVAKKTGMLKRIEGKAREIGFTDISRPIQTDNENVGRIFAVPFTWQYRTRHGRFIHRLERPDRNPEGIILSVFDHTLTRLIALAELLGDEFVDGFLQNILIVEMARAKFAEVFMHRPENIVLLADDQLLRAALSSYLAMIHKDGRILNTVAEVEGIDVNQLKENWQESLAQYFWIVHIYGNPGVDISKELARDEEDFTSLLVPGRLRRIIPEELVSDDKISKLASNIASQVWTIQQRFIDALDRKVEEFMPPIKQGLAAGQELGKQVREAEEFFRPIRDREAADSVVIDYKDWFYVFGYKTDSNTGQITETRIPLPIGPFPGTTHISNAFEVLRTHKLKVVFPFLRHEPLFGYEWFPAILHAVYGIRDNIDALKRPDAIVKVSAGMNEHIILMTDADGVIYVIPDTGIRQDVLPSLKQKVESTLALQKAVARLEKARHLKGFIDLDPRIFQVNDLYFLDILHKRLEELYAEGLYLVRVMGEVEGKYAKYFAPILNKFAERACSEEWRGISSTKENTVTLVSSDNEALATERSRSSTVIRLKFDMQINIPQITQALTIARAIIAVGGEQNVIGGLFEDLKALYLSMVGEDLYEEVGGATTITQLLAIILPPITKEGLLIYEYLLLGKKVAGVSA